MESQPTSWLRCVGMCGRRGSGAPSGSCRRRTWPTWRRIFLNPRVYVNRKTGRRRFSGQRERDRGYQWGRGGGEPGSPAETGIRSVVGGGRGAGTSPIGPLTSAVFLPDEPFPIQADRHPARPGSGRRSSKFCCCRVLDELSIPALLHILSRTDTEPSPDPSPLPTRRGREKGTSGT